MSHYSAIVYATNQYLKEKKLTPPKRSQTLELLAAYLGFKTYAALNTLGPTRQGELLTAHFNKIEAQSRVMARLSALQLPLSLGIPIGEAFAQAFKVCKLEPSERALLDFIAACKSFENSNNKAELEDQPSQYWYEQLQAGAAISQEAQKWADAYERQLSGASAKQAFVEGFRGIELAQPNVRAMVHGQIEPNRCYDLDAQEVLDLFHEFPVAAATHEVILDWEVLAILQQVQHESMVELATHLQDPVEIWACYLFGLRADVDITKSNHWAINPDTGAMWDEYGPAVLDGYAGITLPTISDNQMHEAKLMAERLHIANA